MSKELTYHLCTYRVQILTLTPHYLVREKLLGKHPLNTHSGWYWFIEINQNTPRNSHTLLIITSPDYYLLGKLPPFMLFPNDCFAPFFIWLMADNGWLWLECLYWWPFVWFSEIWASTALGETNDFLILQGGQLFTLQIHRASLFH